MSIIQTILRKQFPFVFRRQILGTLYILFLGALANIALLIMTSTSRESASLENMVLFVTLKLCLFSIILLKLDQNQLMEVVSDPLRESKLRPNPSSKKMRIWVVSSFEKLDSKRHRRQRIKVSFLYHDHIQTNILFTCAAHFHQKTSRCSTV